MSTSDPNPFESPEVAEAPIVRGRAGKGPRAREFGGLMLQLCVTGGLTALLGAVLSLLFLRAGEWAVFWCVGLPVLLLGVLIFWTGRGVGAYKAWAWYAAVILLVPLNIALAALAISASIYGGTIGLATLLGPVYCAYVLWLLLSPTGRESYWRGVAAIDRARNDPSRTVRKRYRRSR